MSPGTFDDDDRGSMGGGSISHQFRNPLYDYNSSELEDNIAANSYVPQKNTMKEPPSELLYNYEDVLL